MSTEVLWRAAAATWPPARVLDVEGWQVADGQGGGKRVSSARPLAPGAVPELAAMERAQGALGQTPLVQVRGGEDALDAALDAAGYAVVDPTRLLVTAVAALPTGGEADGRYIIEDAPLPRQREIWADGGIGAARLAVMARAASPRASLMGRVEDDVAGTAHIAAAEGIAVVHALEVAQEYRRRGVAAQIMEAAAIWAEEQGADRLAVLVTRANGPANALYEGLGMTEAGHYHYRIKPAA
ncbi:GNAT family N-acetyltransferase [Roseicyclus sp. F158]|uniref:GNAT family N-acetyltransferase n=1 Tax=Tropicimonas omnivorans TaxID=3075590 RepID=A0ABU3DC90_9RHOB|nr:GNAT family N-acetyltransferase [Roseicyclus sp. F158]MDT0681334.1 GNAT family N-acetyltransferase [Roseicyclus sp. F158]